MKYNLHFDFDRARNAARLAGELISEYAKMAFASAVERVTGEPYLEVSRVGDDKIMITSPLKSQQLWKFVGTRSQLEADVARGEISPKTAAKAYALFEQTPR